MYKTLLLSYQNLTYTILIISLLIINNGVVIAQTTTNETAPINDSTAQNVTIVNKNTQTGGVDSLIIFAKKFLGLRYRRGGTSNRGFDCSGYTAMIYRKINVKLPHSSQGQSLVGLDVNSKNIQKGDLIFFKGRGRRRKNVGHVGMVISEKGEPVKFIHASVSGGVRIDALSADYYRKRFLKVKRVFNFEGK